MLITQCYKESPLSESGICEWNPSLSILLGRPIGKRCPGRSLFRGVHGSKHIYKWVGSSNLNKPRCAEPEVKRISTGWVGHYLPVARGPASGQRPGQGGGDIETKSWCFAPRRAAPGCAVTHVRSNGHGAPRRRKCLPGGPAESSGGLAKSLWAVTVDAGRLDVFFHLFVIAHVVPLANYQCYFSH